MAKGEKKRIVGLCEVVGHTEPIVDPEELAKSRNGYKWTVDIKGTYYCLLRQFERLLRQCEEEGVMVTNTLISQELFPDDFGERVYRITVDGYQT